MKVIAYVYSDRLLQEGSEQNFLDYTINRCYEDLTKSRSQFQQLLSDHQSDHQNEPVQLLIRQLEDLGDSIDEIQSRLAQLEALNIEIITIESEPLSSATLEQFQTLQRNQRSRKIRQGHAQNRVKTLAPPGKAPYGYRRSRNRYILDRSTAPVVKEFFDRFLLYGSLRDAVRFLEKKYSKKISVSTGQRWLTSPVYRGDLEYQTGEIIPDTHPAILARDEAAQIDRLLRRNRRLPSRTASAPRSLAGLVICQECESGMTVTRVTSRNKSKKEYLYLRPMQCLKQCLKQCPKQCKAIAYDEILQMTIDQICEELPRAVSEAGTPDLEAIKQRIQSAIAAKQSILDQIPALIETGILDTETADLRSYKLRSEIAELQAQLSQLPPVNLIAIAKTVSIQQFWLDLSEAERRFYFREFIKQIEIIRTETGWSLKLNFIF